MEQTISIELEIDLLEYDQNIIGNISFVIDYYHYFSDEGWFDFEVIILSWCQAAYLCSLQVQVDKLLNRFTHFYCYDLNKEVGKFDQIVNETKSIESYT